MNELNLKKCLKCGNVVESFNNSNSSLICCDNAMVDLKSNIEECAVEKHIPSYEIKDNKVIVKVNHVMESEHYIAFISLVKGDLKFTKMIDSDSVSIAEFPYISGSTIYSYCNKHGLWKCDVE